ncbi:hypothetical protein BH10ACT1_BH10ACT1_03980 [soil metagenome]
MTDVSGEVDGRAAVRTAAKTIGAELLLLGALPFNLGVTAAALVRSLVAPAPPTEVPAAGSKTILISGGKMTKALQLARSFHRVGHRVVLVESAKYRFTGHRFSRSVDRFHVVPSPDAETYAAELLRIVRDEGVDVYVPVCSPVASAFDARAKAMLAPHCEVVHGDADLIDQLDDKDAFARLAVSLGLPVPDTHRITDPQQVLDFDFSGRPRSYILKSIPYDPVHRLDLTPLPLATEPETIAFLAARTISPEVPWILQELIEGQEFCTHSTVRRGEVQLHCCCESSAFQVNYEMVDKPAIRAWVERLVGAVGITGQVSMDFIEEPDGSLFAIECNPRTHSAITMFYDHDGVAAAYLEDGVAAIEPHPDSRPTYWLYQELWRLLSHPSTAPTRWRTIREGKDAIFDWSDPLPFLVLHHVQVPWLLLGNLVRGRPWIRVDFNIGKLVEPAGD